LHIATVVPGVEISTTASVVDVGFTAATLNDIIITESRVGDIRTGNIVLHLEQPIGWTQMSFAQIGAAQTSRHVSATVEAGGPVPNVTMAAITADTSDRITLSVTRSINAQSSLATITVTGLAVLNNPFVSVPSGAYGLYASGSLITNIEATAINTPTSPANATALNPGAANFRPWGGGAMHVSGLLQVGRIIGDYVVTPTTVVSIGFHAAGGFQRDGVEVAFANAAGVPLTSMNIDGRVFAPLRVIIEQGFGGTVDVIDQRAQGTGVNLMIMTNIPGARHESVVWTIGPSGQGYASVSAGGHWNWPITVAPIVYLGAGNNHGSTFLPFRSIADAHALYLSVDYVTERASIGFRP
jgi:hypothetical protein